MTNKEYEEVCEILADLQNEFVEEEERLMQLSREHAYRISELENQIITCKNNEDIDFKVFSPRNISIDNSERVQTLEKEKNMLEREKNDADQRISYYSAKSERLGKVLFILKKNVEFEDDLSLKIEEKTNAGNPFDIFMQEESEDNNLDSNLYKDSSDIVEDNDSIYDNSSNKDLDSDDEDFMKLFGISSMPSIDSSTEVRKESLFNFDDTEDDEPQVNSSSDKDVEVITEYINSGVPVEDVKRVCHKVEFTEKIINNDRVRAKLELKEVIQELNDLIEDYDKK